MKKALYILFTLVLCISLVGCGDKEKESASKVSTSSSLTDIMEQLYDGIPEDNLPMALENTELNDENFKYYAFADIKYKEAIASESMTGSIAHSVVLIRLENKKDSDTAVKEIKEKADPRKWICVEAENTYVLAKDDLVLLIMSGENADTIKENFELIDKDITVEDIRKYTKMAYLDDYIMSLPKGYDTILGEGGVNLSGGQKQRLAIARTLSKKSKVILFDEATSALDNSSQEFIKKAIDNLVKDHTVIIVAHRLSTIMDADIIHVVDDGKIVASGTHQELLKSSSIYRNLYETESL